MSVRGLYPQGKSLSFLFPYNSPSSFILHPSSNRSFPTISAALSAAFADASPDDLIFIGGSNYVVGTALQSPLLSSNPQSSEIFPAIPTSLQ